MERAQASGNGRITFRYRPMVTFSNVAHHVRIAQIDSSGRHRLYPRTSTRDRTGGVMSRQRSNLRALPILIALLWGSAACSTASPTPTALRSGNSTEVLLSSGGSTCAPCLFGPVTLVRAAVAPDTTWEFTFPSVPGADYIAKAVDGRSVSNGAWLSRTGSSLDHWSEHLHHDHASVEAIWRAPDSTRAAGIRPERLRHHDEPSRT